MTAEDAVAMDDGAAAAMDEGGRDGRRWGAPPR